MPALARSPCRVGLDAPPSKVLEALRRHMGTYLARYESDPTRVRVLHRLVACRTEAMGTHRCVCEACGWKGHSFNSCGDRHCPQCQGRATAQWLKARQAQMLPVPHFQVVYTLPSELRPLAFDNPALVYGLMLRTGASILQDLAQQRLGARFGITAVLHTWTTELNYHPHVHFLVTAGGLSLDDSRWVQTRDSYLFPERVLGKMYRGRFLQGLLDAFESSQLALRGHDSRAASKAFRSTVRALSKRHKRWVVHVEPPLGRPVEHIAKYLARYVKRVAISNARIAEVTDTEVAFRADDRVVRVGGAEFVHRFLLHVLPGGLKKVRHYGLYAPGNVNGRLEIARGLSPLPHESPDEDGHDETQLELCPACGERRVRRIFHRPTTPPLPPLLPHPQPLPRGPP